MPKKNEKEIEFPEFGALPEDEFAYSEKKEDQTEGGRLKDRVLLKKMVNVHRFTYQDIVNMITQVKGNLATIEKERARMDADEAENKKRLALWEDELDKIEAAFPEIVEEEKKLMSEKKKEAEAAKASEGEPIPSPIDTLEDLSDDEDTE